METFRWLGGWLLVGYWVGRHLTQIYLGKRYIKLGEIHTHANHGGRHPPTDAVVPHSRHRGIQQSANILHNRSRLLKLEKQDTNNYYFHYYVHDASTTTMCLQATMPVTTYGWSAAVPI
jgi:hypothetical protein